MFSNICSEQKKLDVLENEINQIILQNDEIITKIESIKKSRKPFYKFYYEINNPEIIKKFVVNSPFAFSVKEKMEIFKADYFVDNWIAPFNHERTKEVDPEKIMYGINHDLMNMKCENFEDLKRLNQQKIVAKKYITLLRESAAIEYGLKFKQNFSIVNNLLIILHNQLKSDINSKTEEILVKVNDINNQIKLLFDYEGICNNYENRIFPESIILTRITEKWLKTMLVNDQIKIEFNLIHDS